MYVFHTFSPDWVWILSFGHRASGIVTTGGWCRTSVLCFRWIHVTYMCGVCLCVCVSVCLCVSLHVHVMLPTAISAAALLYLSASSSFPRIMDSVQAAGFSPTTITVAKFCMALPLCYHFFNGMRHLVKVAVLHFILSVHLHFLFCGQMWDSGRGFTMTTVVRAGLIVLTCAILSAGGLALYTPVK